MVYLGADHGGFELKEKMKSWLTEWGIHFEDCGAYSFNPNDDYPDFAALVSLRVKQSSENRGILLCRSGCGMVIAANKIKGIRAALITDIRSARHSRNNDDANIASFAGDWIAESDAKASLQNFLQTPFSNEERHVRRLEKISSL